MLQREQIAISHKGSALADVISAQDAYFNAGHTLPLSFRRNQLRLLQVTIKENEAAILDALKKDLGKPALEAYIADVGMVYTEIRHMQKKMKKWAKPRRAKTPMAGFPAKSFIYPRPRGRGLIISPWNYPVQLMLLPLVGAIAAGNTAVIKPSEMVPETSSLICRLLSQTFGEEFVATFEGGPAVSTELLTHGWDHLFFTGSTGVGRIVARAAAETLTPATLELGGKSPCIIGPTAKLKVAASRVVFGKLMNMGQTCVAPDYVWVHETVKDPFLKLVKEMIRERYGEDPSKSPDLARVVGEKHFNHLTAMIDPAKVIHGGSSDKDSLYVEPTIMDGVTRDDAVMQDEIFGPLLPVMTWRSLDEVIGTLQEEEKPLALYIFSEDKAEQEQIINQVRFGGGCINDTIMHVGNGFLPFGGVGASGYGAYHGEESFRTFTHYKAIVRQPTGSDPAMRYPPYTPMKEKIVRFMFR